MRNKYLVHWTYVANFSSAPMLVNAASPFEAAEKVARGFGDDAQKRATLHVHCVSVDASAKGLGCQDFPGMYTQIRDGKEVTSRIYELY